MRLLLAGLLIVSAALAQQSQRSPGDSVVSPEVAPDGRVTFRIYAPKAQAVELRGDFTKALTLVKDEQGIWSVTTDPLTPDLYSYNFFVDGVKTIDPRNVRTKTGARYLDSAVDVTGPAADFQAMKDVPHGTIHTEWYKSAVTGKQRRLHVYTPPGYETSKQKYPVLYLLHGSGDSDREWTAYGRANLIADNLLAAGRIKPMVIVMTDGHVADANDPAQRTQNTRLFVDDLTKSVMPFAEGKYRIDAKQEKRALAGLSMGGGQTLNGGLWNLDKFAWLGVFSMGVRGEPGDFEKDHTAAFSKPDDANKKLKLFWIACGKDDFLFEAATNLHNILDRNKIEHTWVATAGAHAWPVWRGYLNTFLPLIFTN